MAIQERVLYKARIVTPTIYWSSLQTGLRAPRSHGKILHSDRAMYYKQDCSIIWLSVPAGFESVKYLSR